MKKVLLSLGLLASCAGLMGADSYQVLQSWGKDPKAEEERQLAEYLYAMEARRQTEIERATKPDRPCRDESDNGRVCKINGRSWGESIGACEKPGLCCVRWVDGVGDHEVCSGDYDFVS